MAGAEFQTLGEIFQAAAVADSARLDSRCPGAGDGSDAVEAFASRSAVASDESAAVAESSAGGVGGTLESGTDSAQCKRDADSTLQLAGCWTLPVGAA